MRLVLGALVGVASVAVASGTALGQTWAGGETEARRAAFGGALAVGEGVVLVGEPRNTLRPGIVYEYARAGSQWTERAQLTAPEAESADGFGASLALEGGTLLVGQVPQGAVGGVHVYERQGDAWRHVGTLAAEGIEPAALFGTAVALSGDWAVVGAPGAEGRRGAVHVFHRSGGQWTYHARLAATEGAEGEGFGYALALNGSRLLVGAPGRAQATGTVFVFDQAGGEWQQAGELAARGAQQNEQFGAAVSLDGDLALVSAPFSGGYGATFAFRRNAQGEWMQAGRLVAFDGGGQDAFGAAVTMAGGEIWIGAPGSARRSGAAYVFQRSAQGGFSGVVRISGDDVAVNDRMGAPIAVRGTIAAVGMLGADDQAGTVLVFEKDASGAWRQQAVLESEPEALPAITGGEIRCGADGTADIFGCRDVELVAFLPIKDIGGGRGTNLNDIWGWTDPQTGKEWALVGRTDGTSFVDISDPANPRYVGDLPLTEGSPSSSWRDIKVYENHAYIVADNAGQHGMQVFDLTRLRDVQSPRTFTPDYTYDRIASAHNIVINEESGFAYSVGSGGGGETCGGGLHMIDIRDPKSPKFAGCFADPQTGNAATGYSHDAQCVIYRGPDERYTGREICLGSNETALSIADVTDKANPRALSRASYPNVQYAHQGWLTDDHRFFYMNDEGDEAAGVVPRTRTLIWDLADLEDPQFLGEYLGETRAIDHNLYVKGNLMYQSNYMSGLRIIDITNREQPVEVGYFDTLPFGDDIPSFAGSWSNYPYFESGVIAVSSIGEGLFLVKKRNPATIF